MSLRTREYTIGAIVLLFGLLIASGIRFNFLSFLSGNPDPSSQPSSSPNTTSSRYVPNLTSERILLTERMSKLQIPATVRVTPATKEQLPQSLQDLIRLGAQEVVVRKIDYEGEKTGWLVTAKFSDTVRNVHNAYNALLSGQYGWQLVFGARMHYFGIVESKSTTYEVRASVAQPDLEVEQTEVTLEIVRL